MTVPAPDSASWDLVVVGGGPAGAAAAIGALRSRPDLRVLVLDRACFPRDKACGDGVAPQAVDLLTSAGVRGLVDDRVPVQRLRLGRGAVQVERDMARAAWVVPRTVLDARILRAARALGAEQVRHRVRSVATTRSGLDVDGQWRAHVVVGADGAHSVLRRALGHRPGPTAVAIRGYAPVPAGRARAQVIRFGASRQPSYAWSFDRGDGLANVGYGEMLTHRRPKPTRELLLDRLEELLPGARDGGREWRGHHLPLATGRWRPADGRTLLVGDAAGLVNPMTGEGIFYAILTGLAAGRAAAEAVAAGRPESAGERYAVATRQALATHLRHVALAARLAQRGPVLDAGLRACAGERRVFDDLVELGLADGRLTGALVRGMTGALARTLLGRSSPPASGASGHHPDRSTEES